MFVALLLKLKIDFKKNSKYISSFFSLCMLAFSLCYGTLTAQQRNTYSKSFSNKSKSHFSIISSPSNNTEQHNDSLNIRNVSKRPAIVAFQNTKKDIDIYAVQDLNFGSFTATSGSQITLSPQGALSHVGNVHLIGYEFQPAVFEIIVDNQKTLRLQIELENPQLGDNLKLELELISDIQNTFFEVYPPPQKNYINIGGKLNILEGNTIIAGDLNARFNIWLTVANE
ncbi:uncharacterized protein DUF4402 [Jejuia pallidilutea]|uniref:Uncharacterized protein DUF4402 n=1 Tax=Jejuia pallidilutea TaxID=504487 RepID=A0A362X7W2_9FLAO|nr:DUF4402 domain-containing protein [Jejuia pallidilutea]PQV49477.1 uncharacterized protein DUF4402 [Jejuia pallidilutea]